MAIINESIAKISKNSTHSNSFIEEKQENFEQLIYSIDMIEKIQKQLEILEKTFRD